MNAKARKSIEAYNTQAETLCRTYNSLTTEQVLPGIRDILPSDTKRTHFDALDLGCGGGRDSFWLADRGFHVVGVDASISMIRQAWDKNTNLSLTTFIEDEIPSLSRVRARVQKYDFFLMSAVWMHLNKKERVQMMDMMAGLARDNATAYISLRHGPSPEDRPMYRTSVGEVEALAKSVKADFKILPNLPDQMGRKNVWWESVALRFSPSKNSPAF